MKRFLPTHLIQWTLLMVLSLALACQTPSQDQAGSLDDQLKAIEQALRSDSAGTNQILANPVYMHLHSETRFRELIRDYARKSESRNRHTRRTR